jgi:hypothetical protein
MAPSTLGCLLRSLLIDEIDTTSREALLCGI